MPDPSAATAACSGSRATTSHAARAASSAPTDKVMRVIAVPGGCRSNRTMGEDRASVATRHLGRMPRPRTPDDPLKLKEPRVEDLRREGHPQRPAGRPRGVGQDHPARGHVVHGRRDHAHGRGGRRQHRQRPRPRRAAQGHLGLPLDGADRVERRQDQRARRPRIRRLHRRRAHGDPGGGRRDRRRLCGRRRRGSDRGCVGARGRGGPASSDLREQARPGTLRLPVDARPVGRRRSATRSRRSSCRSAPSTSSKASPTCSTRRPTSIRRVPRPRNRSGPTRSHADG